MASTSASDSSATDSYESKKKIKKNKTEDKNKNNKSERKRKHNNTQSSIDETDEETSKVIKKFKKISTGSGIPAVTTSSNSNSTTKKKQSCTNEIHQKNLDKYIEKHSHLKLHKAKNIDPIINFNDLNSEDNEFWIIQCPKDLSIDDIKEKKLKVNTKIKFSDKNIECITENIHNKNLTIICGGGDNKEIKQHLISVPISGKISIRQCVTENPITEDIYTSELVTDKIENVPFPENLKMRHPLFGINYSEKIIESKKALKIKTKK